ncbi:MAG TPA: hydroxyacylglutathione hydrolase [Gammaproteobacteria bacterium]|nr:hydroxyacylglutathione hydrolase [Gammaproteobacteria bacterium]HBF63707.1 hydroxyacylglutathione hydrolase [Gammaproteobacteria bacterium]HBK12236.1 hydroxyacylglutathione hydrolase [Gammaproteobacteria bacterium]
MEMLEIYQIPCLQDNYGFLVHDPETGATATIDTPEVAPINQALAAKGWRLTHILNTHHHFDHAGGNEELKAQWNCQVVGAAIDAERIPGIDVALADGDTLTLGSKQARIIEVPGHTSGHIAYYFAADEVAFVGDTLFALGCGRLFEGTPEQMSESLGKIMALPDATTVYCAHEYTEANAAFAVTMEPANPALQQRVKEIQSLRAAGKPTVPTSIGLERATNPFVRSDSAELQAVLNLSGADEVAVFAETRRRKDHF